MEVELVFLMKYKLNPFDLLGNITLLDLESYMARIEYKIKEEEKEQEKQKGLGKSLAAIRDILNAMNL
jgi:hypothetical protein